MEQIEGLKFEATCTFYSQTILHKMFFCVANESFFGTLTNPMGFNVLIIEPCAQVDIVDNDGECPVS